MTVYYQDDLVTLWHGDCMDVLATLPDASIDAVVTDPPYGLEFMSKEWDAPWKKTGDAAAKFRTPSEADQGTGLRERLRKSGPDAYRAGPGFQEWCEIWARECLRVLKPGGHLLAFGGTRTWHRLVCAVEDAGFEIRDSIAWIYAQGFAKSWNFSTQYSGEWCYCVGGKAVPFSHASDTDVLRRRSDIQSPTVPRGESEDAGLFPSVQRETARPGVGEARAQGPGSLVTRDVGPRSRDDARREEPGMEGRLVYRAGQGVSDDSQTRPPASEGERLRGRTSAGDGGGDRAAGPTARGSASHERGPCGQSTGESEAVPGPHVALDDGALPVGAVCARCGGLDPAYKGFGSALKPAFEPVVCARKPLVGTVAANVMAFGTGALNIDACRIDGGARPARSNEASASGLTGTGGAATYGSFAVRGSVAVGETTRGRWPTNVVLDGDQAAELDAQTGTRTSGSYSGARNADKFRDTYRAYAGTAGGDAHEGNTGPASRFFPVFHYEPKAPTFERPRDVDGAAHPTVKPLDLMRWLVRLVTPHGVSELVCLQCEQQTVHGVRPDVHPASAGADSLREGVPSVPSGKSTESAVHPVPDLRDDPGRWKGEEVLQHQVQGRVPKEAKDVQHLPSGISSPPPYPEDLFSHLLIGGGSATTEEMRNVPEAAPAEVEQIAMVLPPVRGEGKRIGETQGAITDYEGVCAPVRTGTPHVDGDGIPVGTSEGGGRDAGPLVDAGRDSASPQRGEDGQPAGEPGGAGQAGTRPIAEAAAQADCVPALRRDDRPVGSCPSCGSALVRVDRPGTVLDPFLGSGTTAEACVIEGFRCIGIERDATYLPLAVARLSKPIQPGLDFGDTA